MLLLPLNTQLTIVPRQLHFRQPAGTSRGVYHTRKVWYIHITSIDASGRAGVGECAPLPGLSYDALPDYEYILANLCRKMEKERSLSIEELRPYPSILFALETAIRHYRQGSWALYNTAFSRGEAGIPINGLIWMGDYGHMFSQIEEKMAAGYRCIKLKIGAINFEEEIALLKHIRRRFTARDIELRVDANGAFSPADAPEKLKRLAAFDLHSIEQPIGAGQWEAMKQLTNQTPLPIALDEELIGINTPHDKQKLLDTIQPQYIILKPSLHGGLSGCDEWIAEAAKRNIGWWITSALESNIGLNAIAQWAATYNNPLPQGLGTGKLFTDNVDIPLSIHKDALWFHADLSAFMDAWADTSTVVTVQTSGSTGAPKQMLARKSKMEQSARITCDFLGLKKGDKALLCMPVTYIAGKMMVVRALTAGLELVIRKPSGHPLADVDTHLDFAAMTPMQVYNSLRVPAEAERLKAISTLIIGGGAIDKEMETQLSTFPNAVYSTYGMTETLSHIALRRLSGLGAASAYYTPFSSVKLSLSADETLIIDAPLVSDDVLYTNDIAELLPDGRFRIMGRRDNTINTGGVKVQIEALEEKLRSVLPNPFAITSVNDAKFGEAVVLLSTDSVEETKIKGCLAAHEHPKYIFTVEAIPQTSTGKVDRHSCRTIALGCLDIH